MIFTDPSDQEYIERWLDAFVDDAELGMNDFWEEHKTLAALISEFQHAAQKWERLLFTSGGALELSKCSWYCLHWEWDRHGDAQPSNFGVDGPVLRLTRGMDKSQSTTIRRLEVDEAHKTLGVRLEPLGIFDAEFEHLKRKADAHAHRLAGSSLGSYDSITFHQTTFLPGVGYSSAITPLSFDACRQIQGKFISTLLNKISFNRHFPRAVVYGPKALGGLNIRSLYVEQGIAKIAMYIRQLSSESELGKSLRIATRTQQLEAGVGWDLLERPAVPIPFLTRTWITALRDFMGIHGIRIRFCSVEKWGEYYRKSCKQDVFLMDQIMATRRFSPTQLQDINKVRIYFQALTLSDIAHPNGTKIAERYMHVDRPQNGHLSTWKWPRQPIISSQQVQLWQQAIRISFLNRFERIDHPLGPWKQLTHRRQKFWVAIQENKLMVRETRDDGAINNYVIHDGKGATTAEGYELTSSDTIPAAQTESWTYIPAEVTKSADRYHVEHRGVVQAPPKPFATNFLDFVLQQDAPIQRLLARIRIVHHEAIAIIRQSWEEDIDLMAATDGSAPSDGTFGWILATDEGESLVECCGPVDGAPDQISSGRAESTAILSLGIFFALSARYFGRWPGGKCRNVTDAKVALKRVKRASQSTRMLRSRVTSDMDCSTAYRHLGTHIYQYLEHQWIKGHQDNYKPVSELSSEALLNIRADELAEEYRSATTKQDQSHPCTEPIPGQRVQLIVNNFAITKNHAHWIRYQITGCDHRAFLQKKHNWSNKTWDSIDWYGFQRANSALSPIQRRRVSKFVHGWWNTGTQRRKHNKCDFILCPRCGKFRETTEHVLTCSRLSETTQGYRASLHQSFSNSTPASIVEIFLSILRQIFRDPACTPVINIKTTLPFEVQRSLRAAIREQQRIGWLLMLRGYLAQGWTRVYSLLSGNGYATDTTTSWSSKIIDGFWTYAFNMWDLRCKILNEQDSTMKHTKIDNEIRALYKAKATFLQVDQSLFYKSLASVLAEPTNTKEARLVGLKAARLRWQDSISTDEAEDAVNPRHHRAELSSRQ